MDTERTPISTHTPGPRYRDFLHDSFIALRARVPKAADGVSLQAWLDEVADLLAGVPLGIQCEWIDLYATVLLIENGGVLPEVALAMVKHAVFHKQRAMRSA